MRIAAQRPLLQLGSEGKRVKELEQRLGEAGYLKGAADARFDKKTAAAVVAYKQDQGWRERAVVGARMENALGLDGKPERGETPSTLKGATYNCRIHRSPKAVKDFVSSFARSHKLDFIQLQEISGYHDVLRSVPGYRLVTFPRSKDHGETGVLVRDGLRLEERASVQSTVGWTNVDGGKAQPRAATTAKLAGWLQVASVHAPPAIDWKNGHAVGPEQRIKSYGSLVEKLRAFAKSKPGDAVLMGGDWNEGTSTGGKWSPSWLAAQTGMRKYSDGRIDWEMARGAKVSNVRVGPDGGSDHRIVTFTVKRAR